MQDDWAVEREILDRCRVERERCPSRAAVELLAMAECLPADFGGPVDRPFEAFPESDVQASIVDRFEAIAKRFPDRLAIQDQANSFTYRELGAHLAMELFLKRAGLKMTNVNYKGGSPALAAVVAGEIPIKFSVLSDVLPQAASGTIRILAVSSEKRAPQVPEVPTLIESGFPGYKVMSWIGLMAPAGTPKEIVDQIAAEVGVAMKDKKFVERLKDFGAEPLGNSPEEFKAMIHADIALWGEAVGIAGAK